MPNDLSPAETINPDAPLRLSVAVRVAYPDGSMTVSGLSSRSGARAAHFGAYRWARLRDIGQYQTHERIMPARSKGTRLWLRKEKWRDGELIRKSAWFIIDGGRHFGTGCAAHEIEKAELRLSEYVALKYQPSRKERDIELIDVADVLTIYLDDTGLRQASQTKFEARIGRLNDDWGGKTLAEVTGETCRDYVRRRGTRGGSSTTPRKACIAGWCVSPCRRKVPRATAG